MAGQWYCQLGAQQYGPVDFATFQSWAREGRIAADDLVWTEGMANWQPAKTIPNLFADAPAGATQNPGGAPQMPPFVPQPMSPPYGYQMQAWTQPHRGTMLLIFGILGIVCCIVFAIIAWAMGSGDLKAIREGRMDPSGEGLTKAGMILGIIGTILQVIGIAVSIFGNVAAHSRHFP